MVLDLQGGFLLKLFLSELLDFLYLFFNLFQKLFSQLFDLRFFAESGKRICSLGFDRCLNSLLVLHLEYLMLLGLFFFDEGRSLLEYLFGLGFVAGALFLMGIVGTSGRVTVNIVLHLSGGGHD